MLKEPVNEVIWDTKKLMEQTCMSMNTMKDQFFYHEDFPKYKPKGKWLYPAEETATFLLKWLKGELR